MSKIRSYKQIQKELFSSEFNKFKRNEVSLDLKELEKKRKIYLFIIIFVILFIIIFSLLCVTYWEPDLKIYLKNNYSVYLFVLFTDILIFSVIPLIEKKYKDNVKEIILPELLKYFGEFEVQNKRNSNDIKYVRSLKLFDNFDRYKCDNRLAGMYNGVKIDVFELCLEKIKEKKNGKNIRKQVFDGIFIKVPCVKKFTGSTVIKRKPYGNSVSDNEFEKYFDVNSTDLAELKYLITVPFMNRMVNLVNKKGTLI